MTNVHEAVWRGGEVLTRQHWQRIDRANAILGGIIIVVQGGFSGAPASGTTHLKLGVADYRRWHMSSDQAARATRVLRDLCGTGHERTAWQGFDPHFHDATLGDDIPGVMDSVAIAQVVTYKAGGDGVAGTTGDWQPYRPSPIRDYHYLEDDMTPDERKELFRIGERLDQFTANELKRDQAEAERDKRRFTALITAMGRSADDLTVLINKTSDTATKTQLQKTKEKILLALKEDPDVTGVDNPDDEQMP
jgi:hypothetical protein